MGFCAYGILDAPHDDDDDDDGYDDDDVSDFVDGDMPSP